MSYEYDYFEGKKRVLEIINDSNDIREVNRIPNDQGFTYDNGYYGWVASIFVDIRKSTELFAENKKSSTAKIIRSFSSEIIEILYSDKNIREIGIRGDCVYAIYATPKQSDIFYLLEKAFYINSFIDMLNAILRRREMKTMQAGIGLSVSQDLVIKAGRKMSAINAKVWIGKAVTYASKLSSISNLRRNGRILLTELYYKNTIKAFRKKYPDEDITSIFSPYTDSIVGKYYSCNFRNKKMSRWVAGGMKDE